MRLHGTRGCVGALTLGTFLAAMPLGVGFGAGGFELTASKAFAKDGRGQGRRRQQRQRQERRRQAAAAARAAATIRAARAAAAMMTTAADVAATTTTTTMATAAAVGAAATTAADDDNGGRGRRRRRRRRRQPRPRARWGRRRWGRQRRPAAERVAVSGADRQRRRRGVRVVKLERSANGVEVTYSNGVKEEIENGRYEQKNAAGRTVVERRATQGDVARLDANARNSGVARAPAASGAARVEVSGEAIEVDYANGWREELEAGRYELKDPNNNTVVERPASASDVRRLRRWPGADRPRAERRRGAGRRAPFPSLAPGLARDQRRLDAVARLELLQDRGHVVLDRLLLDGERLGHLAVAHSPRPPAAGCPPRAWSACRSGCAPWPRGGGLELASIRAASAGATCASPRARPARIADELRAADPLQHVSERPGPERPATSSSLSETVSIATASRREGGDAPGAPRRCRRRASRCRGARGRGRGARRAPPPRRRWRRRRPR